MVDYNEIEEKLYLECVDIFDNINKKYMHLLIDIFDNLSVEKSVNREVSMKERTIVYELDDFKKRFGINDNPSISAFLQNCMVDNVTTVIKRSNSGTGRTCGRGFVSFFEYVAVDYEIEKIEFVFSLSIMPYLYFLKKVFNETKYNPNELGKMKKKYSGIFFRAFIDLLEKENTDSTVMVLSVGDIREMTDTLNEYERFSNLKDKVVKASIDEINEYTSLKVEYNINFNKRAVSDFEFHIKKEKPLYK